MERLLTGLLLFFAGVACGGSPRRPAPPAELPPFAPPPTAYELCYRPSAN